MNTRQTWWMNSTAGRVIRPVAASRQARGVRRQVHISASPWEDNTCKAWRDAICISLEQHRRADFPILSAIHLRVPYWRMLILP